MWSFLILIASLLLINLSFASGYRSMQLGTYMLLSPGKLRTVLELDSNTKGSVAMELTPDPDATDLPLNASAMAQIAVNEGDQHLFDSLNKADPVVQAEADTLAKGGASTPAGDPIKRSTTGTRLVVYVFQNRDAESVRNFEYFLDNGLGKDAQTDYVIVVQQLQSVCNSLAMFLAVVCYLLLCVALTAACVARWRGATNHTTCHRTTTQHAITGALPAS